MKNMPLVKPIVSYFQGFFNPFFELLSLVLFNTPKQIIFGHFQHKRIRWFFVDIFVNGNILQ